LYRRIAGNLHRAVKLNAGLFDLNIQGQDGFSYFKCCARWLEAAIFFSSRIEK